VGDVVVSIGQGGIFWRDAITRLSVGEPVDKAVSPVFSPRSQIEIMWKLAEAGLVRTAMDNSDGLFPSLVELCEKNGLGIDLELERLEVPDLRSEIDPARLWLGWGDWNVIAGVSPDALVEARDLANANGAKLVEIGTFTSTHNSLLLHRGGRSMLAARLESERFARDSWMLGGLAAYIKLLQEVQLP
jgi:thiamine-monophosphate kinase